KGSIEEFVATSTRLYVVSILGGPEEVRVFDLRGNDLGAVSLPPIAGAGQLTPTQTGDDAYVRVTQYTRPSAWYRIPGETLRADATALRVRSGVDLSNLEVTREVAVSKDGTEVPMTIVRARNVPRDGTAPAILTGYGGYTVSMTPRFLSKMAPWF